MDKTKNAHVNSYEIVDSVCSYGKASFGLCERISVQRETLK